MQKGTLVRLRRDELPITYEAHGELWVYIGSMYFKSLATGYVRGFFDREIIMEVADAEGHTG